MGGFLNFANLLKFLPQASGGVGQLDQNNRPLPGASTGPMPLTINPLSMLSAPSLPGPPSGGVPGMGPGPGGTMQGGGGMGLRPPAPPMSPPNLGPGPGGTMQGGGLPKPRPMPQGGGPVGPTNPSMGITPAGTGGMGMQAAQQKVRGISNNIQSRQQAARKKKPKAPAGPRPNPWTGPGRDDDDRRG